jgi:multiple sugar transport system permease protein
LRARRGRGWAALPWLAPCLVLIGGVVVFPAGFMLFTSFRRISEYGLDRGPAGWANYATVLGRPELPRVLLNTAVWVLGVVGVTLLAGLVLGQFLDQRFPGRRAVRLALIVPWAASVVMTSTVFVYGLDPFYGIIQRTLVAVGLATGGTGFLRTPVSAFVCAMAVAVFVSVPFTTYVVLAGLQTIPADVREAALMDGAGPVATYRWVVFPHLRPALAVAALINIINVFNSLPILRLMTGSIPGYAADTTTTLTFKLIQADRQVDAASALSVLNFVVVLVVIAVYLRVARPMRER